MKIVEFWGYFQKRTFINGEFSVAVFQDAITKKPFKVVGSDIPCARNIKYHLLGEISIYKKTGEESLKLIDYEIAELDEESSFVEYLAMPPIKLNRTQGKKIYKLFGKDAVSMLDTKPEIIYNAVFKN